MAGLARAAFDAFVWGAEMAPVEKLRDGRSSGLRWPSFERETQQPTERWCRREGGRWRGDANGRNAWARTFKWSDEKNKNREGDGASDFDGFYWIGGRNNQLTSDRIGGIYLGETARRAITVGEDTVESFQPSDFGQKINITKFVVA